MEDVKSTLRGDSVWPLRRHRLCSAPTLACVRTDAHSSTSVPPPGQQTCMRLAGSGFKMATRGVFEQGRRCFLEELVDRRAFPRLQQVQPQPGPEHVGCQAKASSSPCRNRPSGPEAMFGEPVPLPVLGKCLLNVTTKCVTATPSLTVRPPPQTRPTSRDEGSSGISPGAHHRQSTLFSWRGRALLGPHRMEGLFSRRLHSTAGYKCRPC